MWYAHIAVVLAVLGLAVPALPAHAEAVTITVDAGTDLGPTNPHLLGIGWNTGSLDGVAPLQPPTVRIDGSLHEGSTGPNALDLTALLGRVAAVRAIGAEPQVILSYMPKWLARTGSGDPRDPTKVAPRDFDQWQALVDKVVETLATAPSPARRFEVWNEPDLPVFWQDSPTDFIELARRTHAAVAAVEERTGLDLQIGGPAVAFPDPLFIVPYAQATNPDFVSWHFYGNHPFFGPDGNEGFVPESIYAANARRNPFMTPEEFSGQVDLVRAWVGDEVELVIDEWNVAAGGFDTRHDTHEGAAFDAAVLTEMERSGLDAADVYRAADTPGAARIGEWGLVDGAGQRKPAWWVFDAWRESAGTRIAVEGDDPSGGLFARATEGTGRVDVIVSSFDVEDPPDREVRIELEGAQAACADVRTIADASGSFAGAEHQAVGGGGVTVAVPGPSVVWIRFTEAACGAAAVAGAQVAMSGGGGETGRGALPATGGSLPASLGLAAVAAALATRRSRVPAQ